MSREDYQPPVSIIMPTYNRAGLIEETVRSIQQQTWPHWELLIVDDGSDDDTEQIIKNMADQRILFFKNWKTENSQLPKNYGIQQAKGELLAFADSDDLWAPDKLQKQIAALELYPLAGFCLANGADFITPGNPISYFYTQRSGLRYDDLFIAFFRSELATVVPTLMVKKLVIESLGYLNPSSLIPDVAFILKLAFHHKGIILYEPLFYRRVHPFSYSNMHRADRHRAGIHLAKSYKKEVPAMILKEWLFRSHIRFGDECLQYSQVPTALREFFLAWKQKPLSIIPMKKMIKSALAFYH